MLRRRGWARQKPSVWKVVAGKSAARLLRGWKTFALAPGRGLLLRLWLLLLLFLLLLLVPRLLLIPIPLLLPIRRNHREPRPILCSGPDPRRLVRAPWDGPWFSRRRMCGRSQSSGCARRKTHREEAAARRLE